MRAHHYTFSQTLAPARAMRTLRISSRLGVDTCTAKSQEEQQGHAQACYGVTMRPPCPGFEDSGS
ncbi:hypothetical protein GCM10027288_47590 [Bordetella tumbae]